MIQDWQLYVMFAINLIALIAGISKGLSSMVAVRDELRDMKKAIGSRFPPEGLMGDVAELEKMTTSHRDTLIEVTAQMGLRRPGGRS